MWVEVGEQSMVVETSRIKMHMYAYHLPEQRAAALDTRTFVIILRNCPIESR